MERMQLFKDVVPPAKQHSNYRMITTPGMCEPEREVIEAWAEGFVDRDGKFVTEFQTTFNACFWELYLNAVFRELGCSIDFSHEAPDFLVETSMQRFVAEATIASHPEGFTAEWERDVSMAALSKLRPEEIVHLATVRLSNAIATKHKKYVEHYQKLHHVRELPFVICLAPFEQPFFFLQNDNALRRVLYGHDQPLYIDRKETGERFVVGEARSELFRKPSGASVSLGVFCDERMKDVSAVVFSSTATYGKVRALSRPGPSMIIFEALRYNDFGLEPLHILAPKPLYKETLLDGLHVCVNPHAVRPLDLQLFEGREVAIHRFDPESGVYLPLAPHGFLIQRGCLAFTPSEFAREAAKRAPQAKPMMPYPQETWREGELVEVKASVGPFTDHHMAHYRGWTILVVRDLCDNDWGAQAIAAQVGGVPEYLRVNSSTEVELAMLDDWHPSKEEAFGAMKSLIDKRTGQ